MTMRLWAFVLAALVLDDPLGHRNDIFGEPVEHCESSGWLELSKHHRPLSSLLTCHAMSGLIPHLLEDATLGKYRVFSSSMIIKID